MIHQGPIAGIAAAGPFIATAGYDNRLILWDALSKRAIARSHHDHLVNHCAFSSNGAMVASSSSDYSARVWEVPSLRLKATLTGHDDDVDMAVFSPDDTLVATCALDRKIRIFDISGRCLKVLRGHTGNILSVAWTRDGERLVSSSVDGTVREWNAATGIEIRCNDIDVRTDTLVIDADGRIFAGDDQGRIAVIVDGQISFTQAHQAGVKNISFDETASVLVTLSYDRTIAIWNVSGTREVREVARTEFPALVWARAAVLIGPGRVAVGTFGSSFGVFDWETNTWDMRDIVAGNGLNAVAVVDGGQYAIGDAGTLFQDGKPSTQLGSLCNFLLAAGTRLFSGGQLGQLFDARSGEILYRHHSPLNCGASFLRDGKVHVVIGTYTGEALVFAIEDGDRPKLLTSLKIYENAIKGVVATDDRIFSVCASTAIAWHDISDFKLTRLIPNAHELIANGCCLAGPRGFASVGRDLKLRIWTEGGEEVYQTPHPNSVKCICASDDRNTLMTGAYTGTLAGFDMATRSWVSFARPTASGISALAYDGRHRRFLASSYDGRVYAVA
jgi:WD40 repeat protein